GGASLAGRGREPPSAPCLRRRPRLRAGCPAPPGPAAGASTAPCRRSSPRSGCAAALRRSVGGREEARARPWIPSAGPLRTTWGLLYRIGPCWRRIYRRARPGERGRVSCAPGGGRRRVGKEVRIMRFLLIGATGQLGRELGPRLPGEVIAPRCEQ